MAFSLHALTLVVPDYDAGIGFYVDQVGFTLVGDSDLGQGKRWVTVQAGANGPLILLAQAKGDQQTAAIGNQTGGRVGFFLATDDFHNDHQRMFDAGVVFEESPREEVYGWVAVWRDPFGNRWDLLEKRP